MSSADQGRAAELARSWSFTALHGPVNESGLCELSLRRTFSSDKDGSFDQQIYGGLQTTNPALVALQRSVLAPLTYAADIDDTNISGQITGGITR